MTALPTPFPLDPGFRDGVALQAFKDAMAAFPSAVCIVTATEGDVRLGRTATAVMSLTATPPTVLVSIDHASALAQAIRATGGFSLAALAAGQSAVADAFAGRLPPDERFSRGAWSAWSSGHPRLDGTVWSMDCRLTGTADIGSHLLFAGGVQEITQTAAKPLVWHGRGFAGVEPAALA